MTPVERFTRVYNRLHKAYKIREGLKHNWTKAKMDECCSVFMESIQADYFNHSGKYRSDRIKRSIERFAEIESDVGRIECERNNVLSAFSEWYKKDRREGVRDTALEAFVEGYLLGKDGD